MTALTEQITHLWWGAEVSGTAAVAGFVATRSVAELAARSGATAEDVRALAVEAATKWAKEPDEFAEGVDAAAKALLATIGAEK